MKYTVYARISFTLPIEIEADTEADALESAYSIACDMIEDGVTVQDTDDLTDSEDWQIIKN